MGDLFVRRSVYIMSLGWRQVVELWVRKMLLFASCILDIGLVGIMQSPVFNNWCLFFCNALLFAYFGFCSRKQSIWWPAGAGAYPWIKLRKKKPWHEMMVSPTIYQMANWFRWERAAESSPCSAYMKKLWWHLCPCCWTSSPMWDTTVQQWAGTGAFKRC